MNPPESNSNQASNHPETASNRPEAASNHPDHTGESVNIPGVEPTFRHLDDPDVPWQEVRSQRNADGSTSSVWEKWFAFSPDPQYLSCYAKYDPGMIVRRHGHYSPHMVFVIEGDVWCGDRHCPAGTHIELPFGAAFGPFRAGENGCTLYECMMGDPRSWGDQPELYENLLAQQGVTPLPDPEIQLPDWLEDLRALWPQAPAPDFNPFNPSDLDARYAAMAHMRATCPVAPLGESSWYAATHEGVLTGLKNVDKFVGSFIDTSKLPEDEVMISAIPEPRHGKIRRVINGVMAPHRTMHAEGFIRDLAQKLLDDALGSPNSDGTASFDLIDEYVDPIPSTVIAHVLGCPVEDFNNFRRWSDELLENQNIQLDDPSNPLTMSSTHPEFAAYIQHHIDIRRNAPEPPDDLIGRFIAADIDGQPLSDDMIRTQTMFLIIAGNETTRNWLGNYLTTLAYDPDLYAEVRAQPEIREPFMEESLRRDCPVQIVARAAMEDTVIEKQHIPEGDQVVFGIASANRDEKVFQNPAEFNHARPDLKKHLAFGAGPHICPGASLARLEARVALEVFCEKIASFKVAPDYEFQYNPVFWALGLRSLPVYATPVNAISALN